MRVRIVVAVAAVVLPTAAGAQQPPPPVDRPSTVNVNINEPVQLPPDNTASWIAVGAQVGQQVYENLARERAENAPIRGATPTPLGWKPAAADAPPPAVVPAPRARDCGAQRWLLVTTIGMQVWKDTGPESTTTPAAEWLVEVCDIRDISQTLSGRTLLALGNEKVSWIVQETPRELCLALAACGAAAQ